MMPWPVQLNGEDMTLDINMRHDLKYKYVDMWFDVFFHIQIHANKKTTGPHSQKKTGAV